MRNLCVLASLPLVVFGAQVSQTRSYEAVRRAFEQPGCASSRLLGRRHRRILRGLQDSVPVCNAAVQDCSISNYASSDIYAIEWANYTTTTASGPEPVTCTFGDQYRTYVVPGTAGTTKAILYFSGGGVCLSAQSCGLLSPLQGPFDLPAGSLGPLQFTTASIPSSDASDAFEHVDSVMEGAHLIFVPYCTGDV